MMTSQHRQEALSLAYVTAVAGRDGMTFSLPSHDYGTDLWLHQVKVTEGERRQTGQGFRVQLKSTTMATLEPNAVVYDLDLRTYEMLRASEDLFPILLVVNVMPVDEAQWLVQDETRLEQATVRIGYGCVDNRKRLTQHPSASESRVRTSLHLTRFRE